MGLRPLSVSIKNEGGIPDHGATPLYLVRSKMRMASRIHWPFPISASTQMRGGIPDQVANHPNHLNPILSNMRGVILDQVAIPLVRC